MTQVPSALVGSVLHETYRLDRLIAKGGMGAVYEAGHLRLSRRFAVKVLVESVDGFPEVVDRFRREAEIIGAIGHPHIVEAVDFNHTQDGLPYIVMELLEGETLATRLERDRRLPLYDASHIFMQAASALEAAHNNGVIHRDLKPQNVFLCRRGRRDDFVKLFDFGISKVVHAMTALTQANVVMGTVYYMSPEQLSGAADIDLRADIYAMGCILYEMLIGETPFAGETPLEIFKKVRHLPPPNLVKRRPDIPAQVDAVVLRSLAKNRDDRYASMLEFWDALADAMHEAGVEVPETPEERQSLWPDENTLVTAAPDLGAPPTLDLSNLDLGDQAPNTTTTEVTNKAEPPLEALPTTPMGQVLPPPEAATMSGDEPTGVAPIKTRISEVSSHFTPEIPTAQLEARKQRQRRRRLLFAGLSLLTILCLGGAGWLLGVGLRTHGVTVPDLGQVRATVTRDARVSPGGQRGRSDGLQPDAGSDPGSPDPRSAATR